MIIGILIGFSFNVSAQESPQIPSWVKTTAKFWVNGDVGDADFIKAIQWMVTNGIITLPNNSSSASNNNPQTSSSTMANSPLSVLLPTSEELGSLWKIQDPTYPTKFAEVSPSQPVYNIKGQIVDSKQGQPTNTIEEILEKSSTPLTVTVFTIDIASFQSGGGMSYASEEQTRDLYSKMIVDYQNNHNGYKSTVFVPTPTNIDTTCSMYTYGTTQSIPQQTVAYDMFCIKNTSLFMIYATGTDIGMIDDLKSITNNILQKIS